MATGGGSGAQIWEDLDRSRKATEPWFLYPPGHGKGAEHGLDKGHHTQQALDGSHEGSEGARRADKRGRDRCFCNSSDERRPAQCLAAGSRDRGWGWAGAEAGCNGREDGDGPKSDLVQSAGRACMGRRKMLLELRFGAVKYESCGQILKGQKC